MTDFGNLNGPDMSSHPKDEDLRSQENSEISERFHASLGVRGSRSPYSPSYLASLPRSALERHRISAEDEERVLYLYAATFSLHKTVASSGLSMEKVRAIVYSPSASEKIQALRDDLKISLLQKIEETQVVLLDEVQNPQKLKDASITQLSSVFSEISETQGNLLSSLRESSGGLSSIDPLEAFDGEDLEYLALLRRKLAIGASSTPPPEDFYDSVDSVEAHFVEGSSVNLDPPDDPPSPTSSEDPPDDPPEDPLVDLSSDLPSDPSTD